MQAMLHSVDDEFAKLGVEALDLGEGLRCLVSPDLSGGEDAGEGPGAADTDAPILVVIPGADAPLGLWSTCELCRTKGLEVGSCLPYARRALALRWDVLLVRNGAADLRAAWGRVLSRNDRPLYIVAHSLGGAALVSFLESRPVDAQLQRVLAIAMCDSVHKAMSDALRHALRGLCANWVPSSSVSVARGVASFAGCRICPAETPDHLCTPFSAMDAVFAFFASGLPVECGRTPRPTSAAPLRESKAPRATSAAPRRVTGCDSAGGGEGQRPPLSARPRIEWRGRGPATACQAPRPRRILSARPFREGSQCAATPREVRKINSMRRLPPGSPQP